MGGPSEHGYMQLALSAMLLGGIGTLVKLASGLDSIEIVFFRAIVAALAVALALIATGKLRELAPVSPLHTLFIGLFQGLQVGLYVTALFQTTVSNAVFLLYTAPVFSIVLAAVFLREKIEKETLVGIAVTTAGIILLLDPGSFSLDSKQTVGNLLALCAGFFYAAMAIASKPLLDKASSAYVVFWQYAVIAAVFAFFLKPGSLSAAVSNWWQLGALGIFCTAIAYFLFMEGVKKVKAQRVFIITTLEPLVGSMLALVFLREIPSWLSIAGAVLIIYGVWRTTHSKKEES